MYPYDFIPENPFIDDKLIFIAMPFHEDYEKIYTDLIKPAINKMNDKLNLEKSEDQYYDWRAKDFNYTRTGWIEILNKLWSSRLVVGVLTGNNANVYYELGIAHSTQQISRQILIAEKSHNPKFDLKDLIYLPYDPKNFSNSIGELSNNMIDMIKLYDYNNDLTLSIALSKLDYFELDVIGRFWNRSHFILSEEIKKEYSNGISGLTKSRLLRFSYKKEQDSSRFEYSFYWTKLGNALLRRMELIDENTLLKRQKEYYKYFKNV